MSIEGRERFDRAPSLNILKSRTLRPMFPKMSLGQNDRRKELKVPTWANRTSGLEQTPRDLDNMRVQFFGVSAEDYPDALLDAVFQLEVEIGFGTLLH